MTPPVLYPAGGFSQGWRVPIGQDGSFCRATSNGRESFGGCPRPLMSRTCKLAWSTFQDFHLIRRRYMGKAEFWEISSLQRKTRRQTIRMLSIHNSLRLLTRSFHHLCTIQSCVQSSTRSSHKRGSETRGYQRHKKISELGGGISPNNSHPNTQRSPRLLRDTKSKSRENEYTPQSKQELENDNPPLTHCSR